MKKNCIILLCLFLSHCQHELNAQQSFADFHVRLSAVNSNDGLSQGFIPCISQDKRGYIWFATKDGLNRYDGYNFTVFRHDVDNPNSVSDNFIYNFHEDSRGLLWVVTPRGLDVFDPVKEIFSHVNFIPAGSGLEGEPRGISEDAFGNIWYWIHQTNVCMTVRMVGKASDEFKVKYACTPVLAETKIKLFPDSAQEFCFDADGGLWVAKEQTLFYASKGDQSSGKFTQKYNASLFCGFTDCKIIRMLSDSSSRKLYFITTAGIAAYDLAAGKVYKNIQQKIFDIPYRKALALDKSGNIWLYNQHVVLVCNLETGIFRKIAPLNIDAKTWSTYEVESILVDRSGIVWLGTNGFSVFKYNPQVARFHFIQAGAVTGINGDDKGRICIEVNSKKIAFDPAKSEFGGNLFSGPEFGIPGDGPNEYPGSFVQDRDGIFWLGYAHGYLGRYDEEKNEIRFFGNNSFVNTGSAHNIWLDNEDNPWVVLDSNYQLSIRKFDKNTKTFSELIPFPEKRISYAYQLISATYVSPNGDIWFGTIQGLFCYSPATKSWKTFKNIPGNKTSLSNNIIFSLCIDPVNPNFLWLGTNSGGLNRFDISKGTFTRFTEENGLPNNVVYGILSDNNKNIWLSTNRGLCRFNVVTYQCKNFLASDGLQGNEFNRYAYYKAKDGALYFGGIDGFNFFYPDELGEAKHSPQIVFTAFRLFNSRVSFRDSGAVINKPVDFMEELVLTYDQNVIAIEFAAMDFAASEKNRYKYMLEGFDKDWTYSGVRREAIYTGLTPGQYTFIIKAASSDGVWSKEGRTIRITVMPPWWKTWWARVLFVMIGIGLLGLFIWLRTSSLRRTQTMLEQKVKERTGELHETITNLKQTQAQLVQNEKLASFGQLTAGIAHEIKNPLNFINNFSELGQEMIGELKDAKTEEEREEIIEILKSNLSKINFHGTRVDSIIKSMLDHSRTAGSQKLLTDLNKLCDEYSNLAYHSIRANVQDFSCNLKKQFDYNLPSMNLNPQDISRVLLNMLNNAFYAVNERRKIAGVDYTPEVIISTSREKNMAVLIVYDNGCGISDEMKNKVFKPFYTSKRPGEGTGLGLSISYDIIQSHGGQMQMESTLNEFTRFTIRIPITEPDNTPLT